MQQNTTCSTTCPLSTDSSLLYQDFLFDSSLTITGVQITLSEFTGDSPGLHILQLPSSGAFVSTVRSQNQASCFAPNPSNTSFTGSWEEKVVPTNISGTTELVLVSDVAVGTSVSSGPSFTWIPYVSASGNYDIFMVIPGCTNMQDCASRTLVKVTLFPGNGLNPSVMTVDQTNTDNASISIYSGPILPSSPDFVTTVTMTLADSPVGTGLNGMCKIVADQIQLVLTSANATTTSSNGSSSGSASGSNEGFGFFEWPLSSTASVDATSTLANSTETAADLAAIDLFNGIGVSRTIRPEPSSLPATLRHLKMRITLMTDNATFLSFFDGQNWTTLASTLQQETIISQLAMVPLQDTHAANSIIESDQMLMISGSLDDSSFGNASSALFDGASFIPYIVSSTVSGSAGSVYFVDFLATGVLILISIAIAAGVVFLLVLIGILWTLFARCDREDKVKQFNAGAEDDESIHHCPSSLLKHINAATRGNIIGAKEERIEGDGMEPEYGHDGNNYVHSDTPSAYGGTMENSRPAHARYSFDGASEGELALTAGTEVEVLDDQDHAWWYARDVEECHDFAAYLKNPTTPEDQTKTDYLLRAFCSAIPYLPKAAAKFGQDLQTKLQPMITKPSSGGIATMQEVVACLCTDVQYFTHDFSRLVALLKSCNVRLKQAIEKPGDTALTPVEMKGLLRVKEPSTEADLNSVSATSITEHVYTSLLKLHKQYSDASFRARTSRPRSYDQDGKARLLNIIQNFLTSEAIKHSQKEKESAKGHGAKPVQVNMEELVGNTDGFADSGVSSAVVQRYLAAFSTQDWLTRFNVQSFPVIIALETSPSTSLSNRASALHALLHNKHTSLLNSRFTLSALKSFEHQRKISPDAVHGYRMQPIPVAVLHRWYSLIFQDRSDYKSSQDDVEFTRYMAENFSAFDYKTQEEVIMVIKFLTMVLSTTGSHLLEVLSPSHLLSNLHSLSGSQTETNQGDSMNAKKKFDDELPFIRTSVVVGMVMLLKAHLKTLYGLSEELPFAVQPVLMSADAKEQKERFIAIWNQNGVTGEPEEEMFDPTLSIGLFVFHFISMLQKKSAK
ncbi:hypothetical protein BT96DRAFT_1003780 [Gymnopus androsaceus JB14]|uniref:SH3 domain-containing protein n=1 Tax=Gymnopus androsaceus JB14 TaxID=1447944 RepID=A0A6A4GSV0_9AGAR|nr:hypothetical protein BT96DRAFT_1003780 [Gymnopus androsaceus JB14]